MKNALWVKIVVAGIMLLLAACADGGDASPDGVVTLLLDEGVNFSSGAKQIPGNFQDSDVWATSNATLACMGLSPGGPTPISYQPVDWLKGQTFAGIDDVPSVASDPVTNQSLTCAETGGGFLIESKAAGWIKVWIQDASVTSVTLVYEPAAP